MSEVIWSKGVDLDQSMHTLTVGNDHIIDREFVEWDCLGSAAHIRMLAKLGILQNEEVTDLISALGDIFQEAKDRQVEIPPHLEDAHNYLENRLVERLGELGKKVHAGRSRNDQVLVTTRLHLRDALIKLLQRLHRSILILHAKHQEIGQVEFPGYTHMQPAMPSSLGMWLHSQMEGLLELIREGLSLYSLVNINPLGVSAGFGSNIPLDKAYTSEQLGFARFHRSPIDGNNSRGRYESRLMHYCVTVADILEKAACDLMMYTMKEFAFLKLPDSMVTGSSIMPQKKNYDIAELLRGRGAKVRSAAAEIDLIKMKLTSSYNRDFQYVKEPSLRGLEEINFMLDMYDLIMTHLEVNEENCSKALPDDIYSTYYANTLSLNKVPYRTAYKQVAQEVADGSFDSTEHKEEFKKVQVEMEAYVKECLNELKGLAQKVEKWSADLAEKFRGLLGG